MIIAVILVSGFVATTVMTIFSYALSRGKSEQFREPELLNRLMARSEIIQQNPSRNSLSGWFLHYGIGWGFVVVFFGVWELTPLTPSMISGGALGLAAGIVGIAGWQAMFTLNGNPPEISLKKFLLHLLLAHILFGIAAALVVVLMR